MLALVACTVGVHKVDRANRLQWKREDIKFFVHAQGGGVLSLMYFEFLLLHHARPFKNLAEVKIHQDSWQQQRCQIHRADQILINSSEALEKCR